MSFKARAYDVAMAPLEAFGFRNRRSRLLEGLTGRVLELGAGTGLNLPVYDRAIQLVATEPQMPLLRHARRRRRAGQHLVCARAEAIPFRSHVFDAVVATLVFCTVDEPANGLREARRVLKPDGQLRIIEHVRWDRHPAMARLQSWLTPAWRILADGCHLDRRTAALLSNAGFQITAEREMLDGLVLELRARPA